VLPIRRSRYIAQPLQRRARTVGHLQQRICGSKLAATCACCLFPSIARADGGRETFHAKAVLCDRTVAYLGSSNVTAASLEHSMELGVVLEGRAAAGVATVIDSVLYAATEWT